MRKRTRITAVHPTDKNNQVVTVVGGDGQYRRHPCEPCPWKTENTGDFPPEAFAHSANTAEDMSTHIFGCHEAGTERPVTCAGFLLRGAEHNMSVRMKSATRELDLSQVDDGEHELHPGYVSMAVANGVHPRDPALARCRLSSYEELELER